MTWTQDKAIVLCRDIEAIAPEHGCHVALTGGLLYKFGERKDCDLVFYRIRQAEKIDIDGLFAKLALLGITRITERERFVIKAAHAHGEIDCLFPEFDGEAVYAAETAAEAARVERLYERWIDDMTTKEPK